MHECDGTGHEGPKSEYRYNYTFSLTLALDGGEWLTPRHGRFTPWEREKVPTVQKTGWVPGPIWTGAVHLPPTRFFFLYSLHLVRTYFFVLIVLHFVFTYNTTTQIFIYPAKHFLYSLVLCTSSILVSLSWLCCLLSFLTTHNTNIHAPGGIRLATEVGSSLYSPARSESPYRLSYTGSALM